LIKAYHAALFFLVIIKMRSTGLFIKVAQIMFERGGSDKENR
jgi:hypothetical protein